MRMKMDVNGEWIHVRKRLEGAFFDCLKYAHENGCPWDVSTSFLVSISCNVECIKYVSDNKCPDKIFM